LTDTARQLEDIKRIVQENNRLLKKNNQLISRLFHVAIREFSSKYFTEVLQDNDGKNDNVSDPITIEVTEPDGKKAAYTIDAEKALKSLELARCRLAQEDDPSFRTYTMSHIDEALEAVIKDYKWFYKEQIETRTPSDNLLDGISAGSAKQLMDGVERLISLKSDLKAALYRPPEDDPQAK